MRQYATFSPHLLPSNVPTVAEFTIKEGNGQYRAELPRVALVGRGVCEKGRALACCVRAHPRRDMSAGG